MFKALKAFFQQGLIAGLLSRRPKAERCVLVDQKLADKLPKCSTTLAGVSNDPVNVILVGSATRIARAFNGAGWYPADPLTPYSLIKAFLAVVFRFTYTSGPFTPMVLAGDLPLMNWQKSPLRRPSFRRRHHIRIWKTNFILENGQPVWVGAATYDRSVKFSLRPPFLPHHIDPDIDGERDFIVEELIAHGGKHVNLVKISEPAEGINAFGDPYHTDGHAKVVEL